MVDKYQVITAANSKYGSEKNAFIDKLINLIKLSGYILEVCNSKTI